MCHGKRLFISHKMTRLIMTAIVLSYKKRSSSDRALLIKNISLQIKDVG